MAREPIQYKVPGFSGNEPIAAPETDEPDPESPAYGHNPYRGTEAHGVPILGGYEADLDDSVEETFKDRVEPPRENLKHDSPVVTVDGWSSDVLRKVKGTFKAQLLTENTWVEVLPQNLRRIRLCWWFAPTIATGDSVYFQTVSSDLPPAMCARVTGAGNNPVNQWYSFTDRLFMYAEGTADTYVNIMEEYEAEA